MYFDHAGRRERGKILVKPIRNKIFLGDIQCEVISLWYTENKNYKQRQLKIFSFQRKNIKNGITPSNFYTER